MLVSFKGMSGPGAYAPGLFIFIKTRLYWANQIILTFGRKYQDDKDAD